MELIEAQLADIPEFANKFTDFNLEEDIRTGATLYFISNKGTPVGVIQFTKSLDGTIIDIAILKEWRKRWLTKGIAKQIYDIAFNQFDSDKILVVSKNPAIGRMMAQEKFVPYASDGEITAFVLYKQFLRDRWK